jgi:hypothetical protein
LDELSSRIAWIESQKLPKTLVHIIDREADSVGHMRQWSAGGSQWLVRGRNKLKVRFGQLDMPIAKVAEQLDFKAVRPVKHKGKLCTQWIAGTTVVMTRDSQAKHEKNSKEPSKHVAGEHLNLRLVVSKITDATGKLVAQCYLLSNVDASVDDAQIALWYYWRWAIESFFKLLKGAGHQLESWEQTTARATFNRLIIATQASVMAWGLLHSQTPKTLETSAFLVRLSGRQMKRTKPITFPALLDGLFKLFTMLEMLEHYSVAQLKEFAETAKQHLYL